MSRNPVQEGNPMKRFLGMTVLVTAMAVSFGACGLPFDTPESTVRAWTHDLQRGDVEAAERLMTPTFMQELTLFGSLTGAIQTWRESGYLDPKQDSVKEIDRFGQTAKVLYTDQLRDGRTEEDTFLLVQIGGQWLIDG